MKSYARDAKRNTRHIHTERKGTKNVCGKQEWIQIYIFVWHDIIISPSHRHSWPNRVIFLRKLRLFFHSTVTIFIFLRVSLAHSHQNNLNFISLLSLAFEVVGFFFFCFIFACVIVRVYRAFDTVIFSVLLNPLQDCMEFLLYFIFFQMAHSHCCKSTEIFGVCVVSVWIRVRPYLFAPFFCFSFHIYLHFSSYSFKFVLVFVVVIHVFGAHCLCLL